jgi:hypothetical protein
MGSMMESEMLNSQIFYFLEFKYHNVLYSIQVTSKEIYT